MEYLFIILFIYASYLSIEKYVHTGSIFTWRGRKDKKERRTAPAAIHPAIAPSQAVSYTHLTLPTTERV